LADLVRAPAPSTALNADPSLELEVRIAAGARLGAATLATAATPTALSCPACHGVLSEMKSGPLRYRCQTGHAFTAEGALEAQQGEVDEALMIALRVMEERVTLVTRMAKEAREQGRGAMAELFERRAAEYGRYAATLREAGIRSLAADVATPG
jgi:two-component system chemotaxis response regulator CheB